jgi:glycosyltransferase involved in cell wall biosynthesis
MSPALSVLMPVFNCAKYLSAAWESMARQSFTDFEIIIVDDGSTDQSVQLLKGFAARDARIRFHSRANTGIVGALTEALALARGEFIARMDGDDVCDATRLEKQMAFMRANPGLIASGTGLLYTDPRGRPLYAMTPPVAHEEITAQLLRGHSMSITHATAIFQAAILKSAGYREKYQSIEDLDLFLRLSSLGRLGNLTEVLYSYRQHPSGTNVTKFGGQQRLRRELLAEIYAERNLGPMTLEFPEGSAMTLSDLYADWSCRAFLGGHRNTGLLYALRFLLADKMSRKKILRFGQMLKLARV